MKGSYVKTLHDYIAQLDRIRNYSYAVDPSTAEMQERMISKQMKARFTPEQLREYNVFFNDDF